MIVLTVAIVKLKRQQQLTLQKDNITSLSVYLLLHEEVLPDSPGRDEVTIVCFLARFTSLLLIESRCRRRYMNTICRKGQQVGVVGVGESR